MPKLSRRAGAIALALTILSQPAAASSHHRHHGSHHPSSPADRGGFGSRDPDNIGIYGGRDFGFHGGPNGETTYNYR